MSYHRKRQLNTTKTTLPKAVLANVYTRHTSLGGKALVEVIYLFYQWDAKQTYH